MMGSKIKKARRDSFTLENIEIPKDELNIVYLTMALYGIGALMPWNMFITAKSYFSDYKLDSTPYSGHFIHYVGFASQIPNLIFSWINVFVHIGKDATSIRIIWSLIVELAIFSLTIGLALCDSSTWQGQFFWITMASVVLINIASGIYQNTVYGIAAKLPLKYTGAVVLGSNISGMITSIFSILSRQFAPSPQIAALYYFMTAMTILMLCLVSYILLSKNKFYRFHTLQFRKDALMTTLASNSSIDYCDNDASPRPPYLKICKKCFPQLANIFFTLFITLAIYPAVQSDVKQSNPDFIIGETFYTEILCFFTFNASSMVGSLLASFVQWPKSRYLMFPVILRIIFVPLFINCNYQPSYILRTLPVYITNDWIYWSIGIMMGLSSGYLSSLGMMYSPQNIYDPKHKLTAGMISSAMLTSGVFCGILLSMIMPMMI